MDKVEWQLKYQGAESKIWFGKYQGINVVKKERFKKNYRADELDKRLTRERIRAEVKAINKLKEKCTELDKLMATIMHVTDREIIMTEIEDGQTVCQYINDRNNENIDVVLDKLGKTIALIHKNGIIHGDLTTSNFIIVNSNDLIPIDFGLSSFSTTAEDRAVDLYVLERAFLSTHVNADFNRILVAYSNQMGQIVGESILKKLDQVRMRGRKRSMVG